MPAAAMSRKYQFSTETHSASEDALPTALHPALQVSLPGRQDVDHRSAQASPPKVAAVPGWRVCAAMSHAHREGYCERSEELQSK